MRDCTLKQIATELGISVSTVSRAIGGKSVVKKETAQRVNELAKKYSYTPNEVARSLQKRSTKTIAVVLPDISETFFGLIVKELSGVLEANGFMIILADTKESSQREIKYMEMLYNRQVDAAVVATVALDGSSVERFSDNNKPIVFIDNIPKTENIDAVTIDNKKASIMAVNYLAGKGHSKIATIIGSKEETTGFERYNGYLEGLEKNGIFSDDNLIAYGDYKYDSGYTAMKKMLENYDNSPFTAVYVTSEKMTYGAIQAINEKGLKIPEDISVIGFDIHTYNTGSQKITSIRQPEKEIGILVGERLLKQLKNPDKGKKKHILLDPLLIEGETVCKI